MSQRVNGIELQAGFRRLFFGDRWTFAIEIESDVPSPSNLTWASMWMWIDGCLVGNPEAVEQLGIACDWLREVASVPSAQRPHSIFGDLPSAQRIVVFQAWYTGWQPPGAWVPPTTLVPRSYLVSDALAGPMLDGWWVVLSERDDQEVFTWQREGDSVASERCVPTGTFRSVVRQLTETIVTLSP